jgi:hypothetical protein
MSEFVPLSQSVLPQGIRSRAVPQINGLSLHILETGFEAGFEEQNRPCILLLHGFPELAYSWRKVMPSLAVAGYYADELAKMPTYYIMDLDKGMAKTVAPEMPSAAEIVACAWLTEDELRGYSEAFSRTGFQGGLQWCRCMRSAVNTAELQLFSGRAIDVSTCFISGKSDWGVYQRPGSLEAMQNRACTRLLGCHLLDGIGHWSAAGTAGAGERVADRVCAAAYKLRTREM